jgi:hypothetical protein
MFLSVFHVFLLDFPGNKMNIRLFQQGHGMSRINKAPVLSPSYPLLFFSPHA